MNQDGLFWLMIGSMIATSFASLGARCLRHFSRHDLEEICREHGVATYFSEIFRRHETTTLAVELLATLLTALAAVASMAWAWMWKGQPAELRFLDILLATIFLSLILSAARIWFPRAIARLFAEEILFYTWPFWKLAARLVTPLVWLAQAVDVILHRMAGRIFKKPDEETIEEEIRTILTEGHREGLLEEDAREMIEGVIELGDADVAEIMTPRTDIHMLQVDIPWDELIIDVVASGHTRVPVYDENRDDILGILYSKDLLPELAKESNESRKPLRELVRRPLLVPETKPVDDLLEMFQHTHTHIAMVMDEYGGVAGLVTIEDVLEEIVGEIVDEYDEDHVDEIQVVNNHTWDALGRAHVDEVNEALGVELPEDDDFDTIAGFVFTHLGRMPQEGETVVWKDRVKITVTETTNRRIERVRIERIDLEARESA